MKTAAIKLMKHQAADVKFMKLKPGVFNMSDCGTGKTIEHIVDAMENKAKDKSVLIFCPLSICEPAWAQDIRKVYPNATVSVAYAKNRAEAFAVHADFTITNTDAVVWLAKQKPAILKRFQYLIVDESSAFRHHESQRSRAMLKISKAIPFKRILSGTPSSRSITDLWHQMMILDGGDRLGSSFYKFRSAVCEPEQCGKALNAIQWLDEDGAAEAVYGLIDDVVIRNKLEDCVDIPPNHTYSVAYDLTPKQQKMYIEMEKQQLAILNETKVITAVNAAVVAGKLLQIASGSVYDEFGEGHVVDEGRYTLVADLVEARTNSVVFTNWKHQVAALRTTFAKRGLKYEVIDGSVPVKRRVEIVKLYQAGFYDVLICDIAAAAHGVTLTRGTATIFCSPTYNTEHFAQAMHRIYRKGQNKKTETIVVLAKGTIDEKCYNLCAAKGARQTHLLGLFE